MEVNGRRDQLIACAEAVASLATDRQIGPQVTVLVTSDVEARAVLDAVVCRWSKLERPKYTTAAAVTAASGQTTVDHVVPCRVLVDRMIMDPDECADLLRRAIVLARIRKDEHRRLGGIYTHHKDLYERMLGAAVGRLPSLGRERDRRCDVELAPQPTEPARRRTR
ncbi:MAG TPA: hypothetical protein VIZ67_00020 [Acidimicrobiales bacterium]